MSDTQASTSDKNLLPNGSVIDGRYEILGLLGSGGCATVYRARHLQIRRPVAVKVLNHDAGAGSKEYEARFSREAQIAATINHPNVVTIHDFGFTGPFRLPYLVMELLEGHDLDEEIRNFGPLSPQRALKLLDPCLEALSRGHDHGIIHRDLKPANLFLNEARSPHESLVLLDFGVAKMDDFSNVRLTNDGQLFGTPAFLAPEWIKQHIATTAMDVYQVALVLVEAMTGKPVVNEANTYDCLAAHCNGDLRLPVSLLDSALGPILVRALAKDHTARWPDAKAFRQALAEVEPSTLPSSFVGGLLRKIPQPDGAVAVLTPSPSPIVEGSGDFDLANLSTGDNDAPRSTVPPVIVGRPSGELPAVSATRRTARRIRLRRPALLLLPLVALLLVALLALTFVLLRSNTDPDPQPTDPSPPTTATPATVAPTQPAPTAGPTIIFGVSALAAQFCGAATHSVVEGLPKPPPPARLPAVKLSVSSDPSKAVLFVNGERRGTTPLELELSPEQTVEVKLEREGYLSHLQSVSASDAPELVIKLKREKRGSSTKKPKPGLAIID